MAYVICLNCKAELTGPVKHRTTKCPSCGKRWRLNENSTAIHSTTLNVHSARTGQKPEFRSKT